MPFLLIDNFSAGLDLRRSKEAAPIGSMRRLENAVVNQGGEIEKRRAFVSDDVLDAYGDRYESRIVGPFPAPGYSDTVVLKHRRDSLSPESADWTSGSGSIAKRYDILKGYEKIRVWQVKNPVSPVDFGSLLHLQSVGLFGGEAHVMDSWARAGGSTLAYRARQTKLTFTDDQPTAIANVSDTDDFRYNLTLSGRGYFVKNTTLKLSAINDPADFAGTGSGSVDFARSGQPIGAATALGDYFGQLAIAGSLGVQFWQVDSDPAQLQYIRTASAQVFAPRTFVRYGDGDLLFLSETGVRSLQARDSSNFATITDVGSPIDLLIRDELDFADADSEPIFSAESTSYSTAHFFDRAVGVVHPATGDYWMCLKDKVYVLSRHVGARVQAWSTFTLPVPDPSELSERSGRIKSRWIADICAVGQTLLIRTFGDKFYLYGGAVGDTYDDTRAVVETPFFDMGDPSTVKYFNGLELVCQGSWLVEASIVSPDDGGTIPWFVIAEINGRTREPGRIDLNLSGLQIALRLTSLGDQRAKLSQIGMIYDTGARK